MTSRSSSDDDSGSFHCCVYKHHQHHTSRNQWAARARPSRLQKREKSMTEWESARRARCTTAVLWKLKLSSWFSCFSCASRAFVSCLQGLLFFLVVFPFPILPKWKIHSFNFHFSQSFQVGIFGPPDTLYMGGYFKVSSISSTTVILSHHICDKSAV